MRKNILSWIILGVIATLPSIAHAAPLYEACTQSLNKTLPDSRGCSQITISHSCANDHYVVLCSQGQDGQKCQVSSAPIPPDTSLNFTVCLDKNFLTRHSACVTKEGCKAFGEKKSAR